MTWKAFFCELLVPQCKQNLAISKIMFHIAWIMIALATTHWILNTTKPFLQDWAMQVLFASLCFCMASFLESR